MGFLDRFKKEGAPAAPDALTREGVARVRAVPGVESVEVVDADTLRVTWNGLAQPSELSLADIRQPWSSASGFDRIEVMDDFIAGVAPPAAGAPSPADALAAGVEDEPAASAASGREPEDAHAAWNAIRGRLRPVVGRPGPADADTVRWEVGGVLEATAVLGDEQVALPVSRAELVQWGVDEATVRAAAEENQAGVDPELDPISPGEPAWVPTRPAGHLAGWLCAPGRLLEGAGVERAVVLVPLATELVVVDPSATGLLESILSSTRTIFEQEARPLWPAPLLIGPGGVEPWTPPPEHPCAELVEQMRGLAP